MPFAFFFFFFFFLLIFEFLYSSFFISSFVMVLSFSIFLSFSLSLFVFLFFFFFYSIFLCLCIFFSIFVSPYLHISMSSYRRVSVSPCFYIFVTLYIIVRSPQSRYSGERLCSSRSFLRGKHSCLLARSGSPRFFAEILRGFFQIFFWNIYNMM